MGQKALQRQVIDAESRMGPVDRARRSFDVRLLASALEYLTRGGHTPDEADLATVAREEFRWVAEEIRRLGETARLPPKETVLDLDTASVSECAIAEQMLGYFFNLWFGRRWNAGLSGTPELVPHQPGAPIRFDAGRQWLDEQLARVFVIERFRVEASGVRRVVVPCLNTLSRCAAYAVALMMENRWGVSDRVRICRFVPDPGQGFHIFLDYKLDANGMLKVGRAREFCGPHHANAYRQRKFRDK